MSYPWELLHPDAQRQIGTGFVVCFILGLIVGVSVGFFIGWLR